MPTKVTMPQLGESVAEGTIGRWLKGEGDWVDKDESLVEIITDKVNAELPSPVAGRLVKILVSEDETVPVGADIAEIEEEDGGQVESAAEQPMVQEQERSASSRQEAQPEPQVSARVAAPAGNGHTNPADSKASQQPRISPLARRLAREHQVDLQAIQGTGEGGRIRREDILNYVAQRDKEPQATVSSVPREPAYPLHTTPPPVPPQLPPREPWFQPHPAPGTRPPAAPQPAPTPAYQLHEGEELITPSRVRLITAEHMVRSKRTSPHATTLVEVDMTNLARWLQKNKDEFKQREGYGISFMPFVIKSTIETLKEFPMLNASWTEDNKIILKKRIHIGIAVSTGETLIVPVIHNADNMSLAGLARAVSDLAQRARTNRLTAADVQGATFTVNNPGVFGTIISVPIINQPNAAILSTDAVVKRPVVTAEDTIAIRHMMFMSLSFDHRLVDGEMAARFLQGVRRRLESYSADFSIY